MRIEQDIPLVVALDDASATLEQVGEKGLRWHNCCGWPACAPRVSHHYGSLSPLCR